MRQSIRKLMTLLLLFTCSIGVWAQATQGDDIPSIPLSHTFGDKATVTFYLFTVDGDVLEPTADFVNSVKNNAGVTKLVYCTHVVAHVVPKAGYWTDVNLLYGKETVSENLVQQQAQTRASIEAGNEVKLIQLDGGRNDGAGWYYYRFPEEHSNFNIYTASILDGYVLPKFDLSKATASTDGLTYTMTEGDWTTTLTIDNSKSSFEYNGSVQGPTKLTNTSIIVKRGDAEAVTFKKVDDHVTAGVSAKVGSSLNAGRAIDAGSYALTIKAAVTEAPVALDGANTRASSSSLVESGIFTNSKNVDFTITQKALTVTAKDKTISYGDAAANGGVTYSGFVDGENENTAGIFGTSSLSYDYNYTQYDNVGNTYTITPKGLTATNYAITFEAGTLTVQQKEIGLTWTPTPATFTYSGSAQAPTATATGTVNSDAISVTVTVDAKDGSSLTDGQAVKVGSYTATASSLTGDKAGNYKLPTATTCDFTITSATFGTITANDYSGTYDGTAHGITVTAPDGATVKYRTAASGEYDLTANPTFTNASETPYTVYYQVTKDGYAPVTGSATVTIAKKALTIKAEAKSKVYGEADPTLTYTKEGLLEGDAITGALARAEGEDVGEYAITQGTLSAGDNYAITFTGAKLTINAADFAEDAVTAKAYEGIYDGEAHTITVTAPKSATVEYGTKKDSYDLKETPSYTDAGEYTVYYKVSMPNTNPVTGSQTIKISKKTLTITANAQEKVAGEKDPDLTYTSDGLVEGDAITGALARAEGEGVGEYDITQGTLTAGDNYAITFTGAKLTIKDIKKSFKVVVAESEGGSVSVSKIEAFPGTQINMKIIPVTGYHLETITIKKSHGGEVQHDITFDAKGESWDYFLMPSDDVIITAVFEKDKAAQNIFIYKSYYGEVVANTISADENEPVNLVAHPAYDNCVLDELVVINDEGKQLDLTTSYDSKEGNIYTFMMIGNWVQVYSTFRGTNDVVDGARPFGLDKRFYQLSLKDQSILQTTAETKDVQIAMSLNANIFCQVADDGSLMKKQGEDVGLMIGGLKKGNFFRIDHDGEIVLEIPDIVKIINDAFQQPAHILTRGEDTAIIKPGVAYEVVEDGNLELVLKGSAPLVIKSIIVEGPEPTAINRLQADDEAADLYDLSGRKVDPTSLRMGMYIRNGKKIVIK